jgi:hypothetical protein
LPARRHLRWARYFLQSFVRPRASLLTRQKLRANNFSHTGPALPELLMLLN